jgi:hypothetical protein
VALGSAVAIAILLLGSALSSGLSTTYASTFVDVLSIGWREVSARRASGQQRAQARERGLVQAIVDPEPSLLGRDQARVP